MSARAVGRCGFAQQAPPVAQQVAAAVLPLPPRMRDGARVLGYANGKTLSVIREGSGMVCLASDPAGEQFHVACYRMSRWGRSCSGAGNCGRRNDRGAGRFGPVPRSQKREDRGDARNIRRRFTR
ncbi:MAG: hypothetical protein R2882_06140 [Gemmatimonadales bacterium]